MQTKSESRDSEAKSRRSQLRSSNPRFGASGTRVSETWNQSHSPHSTYKHDPLTNTSQAQQDQYKSFASLGIGIASLVGETLLSHPCVVLRRQCQIRNDSEQYHLFPFSLFPVIYGIHKSQGITCLWKGIGSVFIVRGLSLVTENVLSEVTNLPREVNRHSSSKKMLQHLCLKALNLALVTPFFASSLVETVQSDIASDSPSVLECIKEGARRFLVWSSPNASSNLLPWYKLLPPAVLLGLSAYVIRGLTNYAMMRSIGQDEDDTELAAGGALYERFYSELMSSFAGALLSDCLLYPLEALTHRLFVQGTRTLIDNMDTGQGVTAVGSAYSGPLNALYTIITEESLLGLYKGFGALVLQFSVHLILLRLAKLSYARVMDSFGSYPSEEQEYHSEDSDSKGSFSHKSNLLSDNEDFGSDSA